MSVPVIITSDMTKSPPVLVVYASEWITLLWPCATTDATGNPYA